VTFESGLDDIVKLASQVCSTPVALIGFVDGERLCFKAAVGFTPVDTDLRHSICRHSLEASGLIEVTDLLVDRRTSEDPLVVGEPHFRFYGGVPLVSASGRVLGTLCVLDHCARPEGLTDSQRSGLEGLARQIIVHVELKRVLSEHTKILSDRAHEERQYREVTHQLAAAQTAGGVGLFTIDIETGSISASPEFSRLYGLEHVESRPAADFEKLVLPADEALISHLESRQSGQAPTDVEYRIQKPDTGELRWIARKGEFQTDDQGRPVRFIGIARDVTARRRSEEGLRKAQDKLALALEATETGTFDYDLVNEKLEWDDRCRTLFGLPADAPVTYQTFLSGLHADDRNRAEEAVKAALDPSGDGSYDIEYRTVGLADGLERWVAAKGKTFFSRGRAIRFIGTVRDVTESHEAQRRLGETEERYRLAGRATNDAIWDWDFKTNFVLWNEALTTAYGHAPETVEPTGEWWIRHIHPDDRTRIDASIHAVIDGTGTDWTDEYRFQRADGTYADVFDRGHVIREPDGKPIRMIGAMLDLTRLRQAEADLVESRRQLLVESGLLEAVVQQAPIGIAIVYSDGSQTVNTRLEQMFGVRLNEPGGVEALGIYVRGRSFAEYLVEQRNRAGELRRYEVTTTPISDAGGGVLATLALVTDVEERKKAEEERALLNRELSHRLKNTLTIVQSITTQTLRLAPDVRSAQQTVTSRINALAAAHDTLLTGHRDAAPILDLVDAATAVHSEAGRIRISGPPIVVGPQAALAMSLVLHELSTNALKYGALSVPEGHVDVQWYVDSTAEGDVLRFTWQEANGPPVSPPAKRGFGTRLIEIGFGGDSRKSSSIDFRPSGLFYEMVAPIDLLSADTGIRRGSKAP
jgi:PAS domain S-box-containing protein